MAARRKAGTDVSLKAFHVFFIILSTMMSAGCGLWAAREYATTKEGWLLGFAGVCTAATLACLGYGAWFIRSKKHLSYI